MATTATRLGCPNCDSTELGTLETLLGTGQTNGIVIEPDGRIDIDWTGWTDVSWDSSETVGVCCQNCHWEYEGKDWPEQLERKEEP